jgi:hypothetical protein
MRRSAWTILEDGVEQAEDDEQAEAEHDQEDDDDGADHDASPEIRYGRLTG